MSSATATHAFPGHDNGVRAIALTPDASWIISGGEDGEVRVCDLAKGTGAGTLTGNTQAVRALTVTPDGKHVVCCNQNGTIWSWELSTGIGRKIRTDDTGGVYSAAICPDGKLAVTGGFDGGVAAWSCDTGERVVSFQGHEKWVRSVSISPDGAFAVTGGNDRQVRVWDLSGRRKSALYSIEHVRPVRAVAVTDNCEEVIFGDTAGEVHVWQPASPTSSLEFTCEDKYVSAIAVSHDSEGLVVAGTQAGSLYVWDRVRPAVQIKPEHGRHVHALALTPDSTKFVSGSDDGLIGVWDPWQGVQLAGTGLPVRPPGRPRAGLTSDEESPHDLLGFSSDVSTLAALVADRETQPPLAIALLGQWGSGKSSFIRQLHDQVDRLATISSKNPKHSVFAAAVRQIRFNAWHYSDDHLWVGLVEHLFENLAPRQDLNAVRTERENLDADLREMRSRHARLKSGLDKAGPFGRIRLLWIARSARSKHRAMMTAVVVAAVVLASAVAISWWSSAAAAIVGAIGAIITAASPFLTALRGIGEKASGTGSLIQQKIQADVHKLDNDIRTTTERLLELDSQKRVAALINEISSGKYERYRGPIANVHRDLQHLSKALAEGRREWAESGELEPVERIILYIDDLDRCPPSKVVEVLSAMHLLLALPLFVVVVAIDPRWLRRSVEQYHSELFSTADDQSRPLDYLDKVFQVTFALRPMGAAADALITDVLRSTAPQPSGGESETPDVASDSGVSHDATPPNSSRTEPATAAASPEQAAVVDPKPDGLRLEAVETRFVLRLRPMLATPRAVKKLVNLYRLVRSSIPDSDRDQFVGSDGTGPYQAVLLLLAVVVGATPASVRLLLSELLTQPAEGDIVPLLRGDRLGGQLQWLAELIEGIRNHTNVHGDVATYQTWAGTIARFSFETYDLVTEHHGHRAG